MTLLENPFADNVLVSASIFPINGFLQGCAMDGRFISSVFLLALSFTGISHAEELCEADSFTQQQCTFNTPSLKHNEKVVISDTGNAAFTGSVTASCRFGTVMFEDASCAPRDPNDCAITDMIWINSKAQCSHDKVDEILKNGQSKTISSISSPGEISYQCSNGQLKVTDKECGQLDVPVKRTGFAQVVRAQNLKTETAELSFVMYISKEVKESGVLPKVDRECARLLDDYVIGAGNATALFDGPASGSYKNNQYEVSCRVEVPELRCDQGVVSDMNMIGRYNEKNGEFTIAPGYEEVLKMCKRSGYTGLTKILGIARSYPNVVDDFSVTAICSGKTKTCDAGRDDLGSPILQSAINCNKANVRSGLLEVAFGTMPSNAKVQTEVCEPLGFTSLETFSTPTLEDQTGAYQYYTTRAVCSGYEGSEPLLSSCGDDAGETNLCTYDADNYIRWYLRENTEANPDTQLTNDSLETETWVVDGVTVYEQRQGTGGFEHVYYENGSKSGYSQGAQKYNNAGLTKEFTFSEFKYEICSSSSASSDVTKIDCNTGSVDGVIQGAFNPVTGEYSDSPSDADIKQKLCEANNYAKLDKVIGATRIGTKDYFSVQAQCSEYYGPDAQSCIDDSPCYGAEVSPSSQVPKFCLGTGTCYENLCADDPVDVEECVDCGGLFSFTDAATGSSCSFNVTNIPSALSEDFVFENELVNGNANVFCNDGKMSVGGPSECYKSCQSGVVVGWKDKNGAMSCGQTIPANEKGFYTQGQVVTLSSSLEHTGSATATCDNGNWIVSGGTCQLDCVADFNWGSGNDAIGRSKYNLCGATPTRTSHGKVTNPISTTPGTSGVQRLRCNDGDWIKGSPSTCYTDCSATTLTWGGVCKASVSQTTHQGQVGVSHQGNPDYVYDFTTTGSATASCSDGKWSISGSCHYVVRVVYGTWTPWSMISESCTVDPEASEIDWGKSFQQEKTCNQRWKRTRTVKWQYNNGTLVNRPGETEYDDRVDVSYSTKTGTRDYIVNSNSESPYVTYGSWDCGSYSPSTSTVDAGTTFTQTRSCARIVNHWVRVYEVYASGRRVKVQEYFSHRTVDGRTDSRIATGTKAVNDCRYDSGNYVLVDESESSDYGQPGTEEYQFTEEWVWGGQTIYLEEKAHGRSGERDVREGSTSGYRAGTIMEDRNGGGVSSSWSYAKWMICKDGGTVTPPPPTTGTWGSSTTVRSVTSSTNAPGACFTQADSAGYPSGGSAKSGSCSTIGDTHEYRSLVEYRGNYCRVAHLKQTCN